MEPSLNRKFYHEFYQMLEDAHTYLYHITKFYNLNTYNLFIWILILRHIRFNNEKCWKISLFSVF